MPAGQDVPAALGVREQQAVAAVAQLLRARDEARAATAVDALERHLVEQPARAGRAVRDDLEVGVVEVADATAA